MNLNLQIDPIKQEKVQDKIHGFLRHRIIHGLLRPGQPLKLIELAEAFGTSAMPVREALNRLIAERALVNEPNRSVVVPSLTPERLADLRQVRKTVETTAVRLATARMTESDVARLRAMVGEQVKLGEQGDVDASVGASVGASVEANTRFHFEIYRLSGSEILIPIIESLWLQFGPYLHYARHVHGEAHDNALRFHRAMIDAFARRDPDAAALALELDVDMSFDLATGTLVAGASPKPARRRATVRYDNIF